MVAHSLTVVAMVAVSCKSLVSREISLLDLEAFSIHFSLSISILRHSHFTFHSRSRYQGIFISLFILEMSEPDFHFTFHFSNFQYPLSQGPGGDLLGDDGYLLGDGGKNWWESVTDRSTYLRT